MRSERWKPIVGFAGYEVSDLGRVRSRLGAKLRLLKPGIMSSGYKLVVLRHEGKSYSRCVHHLVLEAFVGPRSNGQQARHLNDRDKMNNSLENLAWGSQSDNEQDKIKHGTYQYGERNPTARLTNAQARQIRASSLSGKTLAKRYGVAESVISGIRRGTRYMQP